MDEDEFDTWMTKITEGPEPIWEKTWAPKMKDELSKAVTRNDASPAKSIPLMALIKRWSELYNVQTSKDAVQKYCKVVLGRQSYAKAE